MCMILMTAVDDECDDACHDTLVMLMTAMMSMVPMSDYGPTLILQFVPTSLTDTKSALSP